MSFDPYKILGIALAATIEEIHAAYRKLCKTIHPDAGGGAEEFIELQRSYEILSNPESRQKYDEIGIVDDDGDEAIKNLQQLFISIFDNANGADLNHVNLVAMMSQNIIMNRTIFVNALKTLQQQKTKHENNLLIIKKRLKSKKKNFLLYGAEAAITRIMIPIAQNEKQLAVCDQMLELLNSYEYEWEEQPIVPSSYAISYAGLG